MKHRKRVSRVHVDCEINVEQEIQLNQNQSHYLKNVLRLNDQDNILIFNGKENKEYLAKIHIQKKIIHVKATAEFEKNLESPVRTALLQAAGKAEHMDFLVQKGTELGVHSFHFFNSERTQSPLKSHRLEKKLNHWRGIIISACEQCGRNIVPDLDYHDDISSAINSVTEKNKIILDFNGLSFQDLDDNFQTTASFAFLVGAEGGLTKEEIVTAKNNGFLAYSIGPRILRMETAAISILGIFQHRYGDMR